MPERRHMGRWIGFLGSWALLVLALGLASFASAGEWINIRDIRRLDRVALIDKVLAERSGNTAGTLRAAEQRRATEVDALQSRVADLEKQMTDLPDTGQTIIVSTEENRLYVRRNGQTVLTAICSTGKGTKLAVDGRTIVFDTPLGKFHIVSKEENPQWVPPDWHYVEQAQKNGMRVVHLNPGQSIDANTGQPMRSNSSEGVWSWLGGSSRRVLTIKGNTVVESDGGSERELPPGKVITAGNAIVIPPISTPQRHFADVLGKYRLNIGDGYAIHGTDQANKLGQSVSHGCVRLGDSDIANLYAMANVGDEVVIY